jgi:hypothetical protein
MMRVKEVFKIKGRGTVATVETDGPCPANGSQVRRLADGQTFTVHGVERFGTRLGTAGKSGEPVGLLLGDADIAAGDELERAAAEVESGIVTMSDIAATYDEASGVKGWKAEWNADTKRIDLTPPPGYVIVYDSQGAPRLARLSPVKIGVSIRKVSE